MVFSLFLSTFFCDLVDRGILPAIDLLGNSALVGVSLHLLTALHFELCFELCDKSCKTVVEL